MKAEDKAALILGQQIHRVCALEAQLDDAIEQRDNLLKKLHALEGTSESETTPTNGPPAAQ